MVRIAILVQAVRDPKNKVKKEKRKKDLLRNQRPPKYFKFIKICPGVLEPQGVENLASVLVWLLIYRTALNCCPSRD